jgi:hypothetical protein
VAVHVGVGGLGRGGVVAGAGAGVAGGRGVARGGGVVGGGGARGRRIGGRDVVGGEAVLGRAAAGDARLAGRGVARSTPVASTPEVEVGFGSEVGAGSVVELVVTGPLSVTLLPVDESVVTPVVTSGSDVQATSGRDRSNWYGKDGA